MLFHVKASFDPPTLFAKEFIMKSPFPGMDPYLENNNTWNQVHHDLITEIRRYLATKLRPRYHVAIEQMIYLNMLPPERVGRPDVLIQVPQPTNGHHRPHSGMSGTLLKENVAIAIKPVTFIIPDFDEIKHAYLTVRDLNIDMVVTAIEILSPVNKMGKGRKKYDDKRMEILTSMTNFVEIDLLRTGQSYAPEDSTSDYHIIISRSEHLPTADMYAFTVRDVIPSIPIPLQPNDPEPMLPLNDLLHTVYEYGAYDMIIDYHRQPKPNLSVEDWAWAQGLIEKIG